MAKSTTYNTSGNREDLTDTQITKDVAVELSKKTKSEVCGIIETMIILYKKNK